MNDGYTDEEVRDQHTVDLDHFQQMEDEDCNNDYGEFEEQDDEESEESEENEENGKDIDAGMDVDNVDDNGMDVDNVDDNGMDVDNVDDNGMDVDNVDDNGMDVDNGVDGTNKTVEEERGHTLDNQSNSDSNNQRISSNASESTYNTRKRNVNYVILNG